MSERLRFPSAITAALAGIWLIGGSWFLFVSLEARVLFHDGWILLQDSLRLVQMPAACGPRSLDVATLLLLLASSWCLGLAGLRAGRWVATLDTLSNLFAVAVGLGVWAWFVLVAGMLGGIAPALYAVPAGLSLLLLGWHWPWLVNAWRACRQRPRERLQPFELFLIVCLVVGAGFHLILAFAPETEYDALEYHLGALREYQKAGRIAFLPYNFYASMPSLTEMLYLWGITLRSASVAHLIHTAFGALTAVGLIAFGMRLGSRRLGLTAAALYYLLPFVTVLAETARIDLATTFFAFLAGAALHRHLFDTDQNALWLAALAGGLAMATKYTAGPVVWLPLLAVWFVYRKQSSAFTPRAVILFGLLAVLPVLPWLVKNALSTGNPVYPIANGIFRSPAWDAACATRFHEHHAPTFDSPEAWRSLLTAPWSQSVTESFSSPALLLFAPLFLLVGQPAPRWKYCAWYALLIYLCWWAFTFRPWRFLFPALPWFALLGAAAIVTLEPDRALRWLTRTALVVLLGFNLHYSFIISAVDINHPSQFPPQRSKLGFFFGRVTERDYVSNVFHTIVLMNENLPPEACVLYVGEARVFYSQHRVLANTVYDRSILGEMMARAQSAADLRQEMEQRGITHVYVRKDELTRLRNNYGYLQDMNWPLFEEFLQTCTRPLLLKENQQVYELLPDKSPTGKTDAPLSRPSTHANEQHAPMD